jgi:hypothetical protein
MAALSGMNKERVRRLIDPSFHQDDHAEQDVRHGAPTRVP